ncbi:ABC transporter permease [Paenibacillus sp. IHBB 10380]|uniref:ABC transporter permease n=1 Tax=Paenibacillus sp. IHBB 10380 TaxID=1566358 RepID=UPI0005CFEC17|nr:ABC transporter permease [Paenibacillus sp. IHBB 10380]AJS58363.1 hypothetical protein UB51_07465 [Paenibacillus sp. IHBB 10380]
MYLKDVGVVFKKEMVDLLRDKKTWLAVLIIPLLLNPLLLLLFSKLQGNISGEVSKNMPIAVVGSQSSIVNVLKKNPAIAISDENNPVEQLKTGQIRAIVEIDELFDKKIDSNESASIKIIFDSSNQKSIVASELLTTHLKTYNQELVNTRLEKLNISLSTMQPLVVETDSISTISRELMVLTFLLALILVMNCVSGVSVGAIDLIAGEKERGTLEQLLITPVNGISLLTGKLIATALFGVVSSLVTTLSMVLSVKLLPTMAGKAAANFTISDEFLTISNIFIIILLLVLLSVMFAALLLGISSLASTFKEAQTYFTPFLLVAVLPVFLTLNVNVNEISTVHLMIPVYNVVLVLKELMYGTQNFIHILVSVGSSVLFVLLSIVLFAQMFRRESIIVK